MENLQKPLIVPWDFTHVAEFALAHAENICNILKRDIILLHIVEKKEDEKPSLEKLKKKADEIAAQTKLKIHPVVKSGSIFETIREAAHEAKAELVVMGTHGRKGMQKLTGSWALKVMANSKVPFLTVQEKPLTNEFEKIAVPIDFRSENKEKVKWLYYLSGKYKKATFLIIKRKVSDKGFKRKIASNLRYVESFLKNNDVNYEIHTSSGKKSFEKDCIDFAKQEKADLLLVMVTRNINVFDYMFGAREQYLISNPARIPVMCLNPKPARLSSGFRAGGG